MIESVHDRVRSAVDERGSVPFREVVELALYEPDLGFYATEGRAGGRRGDFVTSVEVGPLFGSIIADWLDAQWRAAGEPDEFRVAEVGAGVGTLFRAINRAAPACFDCLQYTLVERTASMLVAHQSLPSTAWRSASDLPDERQHVIVANELLDNLAFDIAERVADGWAPVNVSVVHGELALQPAEVDPALDFLMALAPDAAPGSRVPVATTAATWVNDARPRSDAVLVFDYAATTNELSQRDQSGWLRTYVGHVRGNRPLADLGRRDITHDVPIDQLPPADVQQSQADWLQTNGLPARLEAARAEWTARGHIGDLAAMVARSAINEAEALIDPTGLGGFVALEWHQRQTV